MRFRRPAIIIVLVVAACAAGLYAYQRHHYPYGRSHCCDTQLSMALRDYAEAHNGRFPTGEATPEASLSLLYRWKPNAGIANLLRGKTVPEKTVQETFDRGELLRPTTCGWHYVEGLTLSDDPQLALFWDKAGLGHNGGLLSDGGHIVSYITSPHEYIPEQEWPKFLKQQERLLAARKNAATKERPHLQPDKR